MTIRLTVRTAVWRAHVARTAAAVDGLVPVVKGNGYGFGRQRLAEFAAELSDTVAVGTIHELDVLGHPSVTSRGVDVVVLTPAMSPPPTGDPILTVGSPAHIEALNGWSGRVVVKVASPMLRYGALPSGVAALVDRAAHAGLDVVGTAVHPPLAGSDDEHAEAVEALLQHLPTSVPVWVSHVSPERFATLPSTHTYRLRLGTALWHGERNALQLEAAVIDRRPVTTGTSAGYRASSVPNDGHLVMVGAGTANGVTALPDGRSPFHFGRRRLALHEPPHMHTSMLFVANGEPLPEVGQYVDLQRPLTMTAVDEFRWL